MKAISLLFALVVGAVGWGLLVSSQAVPPRIAERTIAADAAWYAALPTDPVAATDAYLRRIPAEVRAKGDAYEATRYPVVALRIVTLIAATAFVLFSGLAGRMRDAATRLSPVRAVQDAAVAVPAGGAVRLEPADRHVRRVRP